MVVVSERLRRFAALLDTRQRVLAIARPGVDHAFETAEQWIGRGVVHHFLHPGLRRRNVAGEERWLRIDPPRVLVLPALTDPPVTLCRCKVPLAAPQVSLRYSLAGF